MIDGARLAKAFIFRQIVSGIILARLKAYLNIRCIQGGHEMKQVIAALAITATMVTVSACVVVDDRRPEVGIERGERGGGPPPWAPAHGYRAKHVYQYYPSSDVYFDIYTRNYFYMSGGAWQVSVSLPPTIRIQHDHVVDLELETDKPYLYHEEHHAKFHGKHDKEHGRPF